jgi:hypothetical protein
MPRVRDKRTTHRQHFVDARQGHCLGVFRDLSGDWRLRYDKDTRTTTPLHVRSSQRIEQKGAAPTDNARTFDIDSYFFFRRTTSYCMMRTTPKAGSQMSNAIDKSGSHSIFSNSKPGWSR